jgi:hypothetical protein
MVALVDCPMAIRESRNRTSERNPYFTRRSADQE